MATHQKIGDATIVVGSYIKGNETKKRYRNIGVLMKSTDQDGERYWMRIDGDALSPSLLILARAGMMKGDDSVSVNIFAEREEAPEQEPADDAFAPGRE